MSSQTTMPALGEVIAERYRLDSVLSSGGMGSVYVATHTQTGRRFAVKIMLADLTGDAEAERRFLREAKLAGSVSHPCVIRVYDVGYHELHPYMVMELLEGESLGQRLSRGKLAPTEAAALMLRVLEGVAAAHRMGIVHRDLKPDNVFLCRSPDGRSVEPKVLDFGISKSLSATGTQNLTKTGIALGTPLYMSPEQVHGQRDVDQRADIYALGVILYEMLAGEVPFNGRSYAELVLKIITGDARPLSERDSTIPASLEGVVARAMAVDRDLRYPTIDALAQDLHAFARGVLPAAPRVSRAVRGPESLTPFTIEKIRAEPSEPLVLPKRRGARLLLAVGAGAALAAAGLLFVRRDAQHDVPPPSAASAGTPLTSHSLAPAQAQVAHDETPSSLPEAPAPHALPEPADAPRAAATTTAAMAAKPSERQTHAADGGVTPLPSAVAAPVVLTIKKLADPEPALPAAKPKRRAAASATDDYPSVGEEKLIDPFE